MCIFGLELLKVSNKQLYRKYGSDMNFCDLKKGKSIYVFNVRSNCGTPNYEWTCQYN